MSSWIGSWWTLKVPDRGTDATSAPKSIEVRGTANVQEIDRGDRPAFTVERRKTARAESGPRQPQAVQSEPWWAKPIQRPRQM